MSLVSIVGISIGSARWFTSIQNVYARPALRRCQWTVSKADFAAARALPATPLSMRSGFRVAPPGALRRCREPENIPRYLRVGTSSFPHRRLARRPVKACRVSPNLLVLLGTARRRSVRGLRNRASLLFEDPHTSADAERCHNSMSAFHRSSKARARGYRLLSAGAVINCVDR